MEKWIDNEIDKTMASLGDEGAFEVSADFAMGVQRKVAGLRPGMGRQRKGPVVCAVVMAIMILLNIVGLIAMSRQEVASSETEVSTVSVLASEYGIGQSSGLGL